MISKNLLLAILILSCALTFSGAVLKLQNIEGADTLLVIALGSQWICALGFVAQGLKKA